MSGKPNGMAGGEVERYFNEGKIGTIADYCETDIVNTYRVWLRYQLFGGRLSEREFDASERDLGDFIAAHAKHHLSGLIKAL